MASQQQAGQEQPSPNLRPVVEIGCLPRGWNFSAPKADVAPSQGEQPSHLQTQRIQQQPWVSGPLGRFSSTRVQLNQPKHPSFCAF